MKFIAFIGHGFRYDETRLISFREVFGMQRDLVVVGIWQMESDIMLGFDSYNNFKCVR